MSYYTKHLFVCVNQRPEGEQCCQASGGDKLFAYAKERIKALGLAGKGRIRVNKAGCLGRCEEGPIMVIYPEGAWYHIESKQDIDTIIERHLLEG